VAEGLSSAPHGGAAAVTVYTKPSCVQCEATVRALGRKGIAFRLVDVTVDDDALAHVRELGHQQVPVVETATEHWSGYRPDRLMALARRRPG
jgi:glutaredoxin-like protein NrdH